MGRNNADLDSAMNSVNEWEERQNRTSLASPDTSPTPNKVLIGNVTKFFDKINVAAIILTSDLKVGDIIEIGNEEEAIRQRVSSMQIDKEEITEASEGADVGIKLKYRVTEGSDVYKII
jgi:hypothetical protein